MSGSKGDAPKMPMPRPDDEAKAYLRSLIPDDPRVQVRPMFGNLAAFVNGNMFAGLFGDDVFVRLGDDGRAELTELGGSGFEPMPGRAMREYVVLPAAWRTDHQPAADWVDRSLHWAAQLPPKQPKTKKRP